MLSVLSFVRHLLLSVIVLIVSKDPAFVKVKAIELSTYIEVNFINKNICEEKYKKKKKYKEKKKYKGLSLIFM